MLTDTHAHLYWDSYKEDLDEVIKRCLEAGVTTIFNVGVDVKKSQQALDQAVILGTQSEAWRTPESDPGQARMTFYSTIGLHPHEAYKYEDDNLLNEDLKKLEAIYNSNPKKVIGIGECGLDYFFENNSDFFNPNNLSEEKLISIQKTLLLAQLDLAKKLDLPIILHIRDDRSKNPQNSECWKQALELVKDWKGILHCYSGTEEITQHIPENFLVSFAANITYPKNEYLRQAAKFLPLEKLCLETDSPFLAPQSSRGQRNEPQSVREIAGLISQIKEISLEEVGTQTTQNIKSLFNLKD